MKKAIAFAFIFMLFFAPATAAFSFGDITEKASSAFEKIKDAVKGAGAGAVIGGALGAIGGFIVGGPPGAVAGAKLGAAAGAIIGGSIGAIFGGNEDNTVSGSFKAGRYANQTTLTTDEDLLKNKQIVQEVNQRAYQKIAELNAKLRSDLTAYDITETGATGDLWARIFGPEKVYGFSAFPVQIKVFTKESPIPFSVVHIRSVKVYLKDEDGNIFWTRTWDYGTGSEGLNGESVVYSTILKVPDPFVYQIESAINTGVISKSLIESIFNASTKAWEIHVDIDAYREMYQSTPASSADDCQAQGGKWDSQTNTCYVFVKNVEIDYHVETTSAWMHVTMAKDVALLDEGMYASLPIKFLQTDEASKWALYQEKFAGALSNFIILTYATPVHVMDSTADYKFFIAPNPGYFDPLDVTFSDDFRFASVRVYKDGHWELADSIRGDLGTLSDDSSVEKTLNVRYTTGDDVLTYRSFGLVLFTVTRDDGQQIKVWLVAEPDISVLQNIRVVLDDNQVERLAQVASDNQISEDEREKIIQTANTLINGLREKIDNAEQLKVKAENVGNSQAKDYAEKAIWAYNEAIKALEKAKDTDDSQMFLNWLNVAKKFEQAGDFYTNAANKALYNEVEQAKLDAKAAEDLVNLANEYKPGFSILNGNIDKETLVIIIVGLAAAFVVRMIAGNVAAAVVIILLVLYLFGSAYLGQILDKLKFW